MSKLVIQDIQDGVAATLATAGVECHYMEAPDGKARPYTVFIVEAEPVRTMAGLTGWEITAEIHAYAATAGATYSLMASIKSALDGAKPTLTSHALADALRLSSMATRISEATGSIVGVLTFTAHAAAS